MVVEGSVASARRNAIPGARASQPNDENGRPDFKAICLYRGSTPASKEVVSRLEYKLADLVPAVRAKTERAIHCLVTNLFDWFDQTPDVRAPSGVAVPLSTGAYTRKNISPKFSGEKWIGYEAMKRAIEWLRRRSWITVAPGSVRFQAGANGKMGVMSGGGRLTRVLPSPALISLFEGIQAESKGRATRDAKRMTPLGAYVQEEEDALFNLGRIRLKAGKDLGKQELPVDLSDEKIRKMQATLEAFNGMNISHEWVMEWPGYSRLGVPVLGTEFTKLTPPTLIYNRVFNRGSFDMGGRFYSGTSSVERCHRHHMKVNGEPVVEADFVSLHIVMAYAQEGKQPPSKDCYDLGEVGERYLGHLPPVVRRTLIKCISLALLNKIRTTAGFLQLLNGRGKEAGYWTIQRRKIFAGIQYKETRGLKLTEKDLADYPKTFDYKRDIKPTILAIQAVHHEISQYFCKDWGVVFQNFDSRIAEHVAITFTALRRPLWILHDGFFVAESDEARLVESMREGYRLVMGLDLPEHGIEVKRSPKPADAEDSHSISAASKNGVGDDDSDK